MDASTRKNAGILTSLCSALRGSNVILRGVKNPISTDNKVKGVGSTTEYQGFFLAALVRMTWIRGDVDSSMILGWMLRPCRLRSGGFNSASSRVGDHARGFPPPRE